MGNTYSACQDNIFLLSWNNKMEGITIWKENIYFKTMSELKQGQKYEAKTGQVLQMHQ